MSSPRHPPADATTTRPENRPLLAALRRRPRLRAGLVQIIYLAAGIAVGAGMAQVTGGPTVSTLALDAMFAGMAAGLIALISVVYALLFLVVQFASTTHSPRLNLFRDSPLVWHAFGLFLGAFAFISTSVLATGPGQSVSILVPAFGLVLLLASLGIARQLQVSALNSLQLAPILQNVTARGRAVIDQLYPDPFRSDSATVPIGPGDRYGIAWPAPPAVLRQIDLPRLLAVAQRLDAQVRLTVGVGDTMWEQQVIIEISTIPAAADERELLAAIEAGIERSFDQDPLLALRLLNDIGLRAVSAAINDPYTAIQAIDGIEGLLRRLATRQLAVGVVPDGSGQPRVFLTMPDWEQLVRAGVDELTHAGGSTPTVRQRLLTLLDDLIAISPPARVPPLAERRARLADP